MELSSDKHLLFTVCVGLYKLDKGPTFSGLISYVGFFLVCYDFSVSFMTGLTLKSFYEHRICLVAIID